MNTTNKPKRNITNFVKLSEIVFNTQSELNSNEELKERTKDYRDITLLGAFKCLITTGYYQIAYNKDVDLIKKNFDFTGSNKQVVLDFNNDYLDTLLNIKCKTVGNGRQTVLY